MGDCGEIEIWGCHFGGNVVEFMYLITLVCGSVFFGLDEVSGKVF